MSYDMFIDYDSAFVRRAHQLLFWGYQRARQQFDQNTEEEEISQHISERIEDMLRFENIPEEYEHFDVRNEALVANTGRTGNSRKEIDILIFTTNPKIRPEFIFEAKRLKKGAFYVKDYVGVDGMQCFLNEDYAKHCPSAAMLGFMQSDDVNHWHKQLEEQFTGSDRSALRIQKPLTRCTAPIIANLPDEWQSEHSRLTRPAITIYHLFLDCS